MDELNCTSVRQTPWGNSAHPADSARPSEPGDRQEIGLKYLPHRAVPPMLNMRLRVLASREHSRRARHQNFRTWLADKASRIRLSFDNLLKPLCVPAAGGLLASSLCFCVIVDTLHLHDMRNWQEDIPINFSSEIALGELSPFSVLGQDVMVQLSVDSEGNVTDYALPQTTNPSAEQLQQIGNLVLFSTFTPAMRLGRPIASKRLFYIRHISVKG